ncbi:hypothetical protein DFJ63DRAFT_313364 [Scheffersomyces coipomensis]|uniref:uncharacterized protein n=1 Tax=Scheffersomyces coipomensis TaxID=1788519 RepID=UPI00315D822D
MSTDEVLQPDPVSDDHSGSTIETSSAIELPDAQIYQASNGEGSDTDDDYSLSDDDDYNGYSMSKNGPRLSYTRSIADHTTYLVNSLSHALDSVQLDKSLALEAQVSGKLNNQNQILIEKRNQVIIKLKNLQSLYKENFLIDANSNISKIEQMRHDITDIEKRISSLKSGNEKGAIFPFMKAKRESEEGVIKKYPIEYNQARNKILERQIDDA